MEGQHHKVRTGRFSSLRVNADNYNKKTVLAFWAIFASLLLVVFVTSNYSTLPLNKLPTRSSSRATEENSQIRTIRTASTQSPSITKYSSARISASATLNSD